MMLVKGKKCVMAKQQEDIAELNKVLHEVFKSTKDSERFMKSFLKCVETGAISEIKFTDGTLQEISADVLETK